MTAGLLMLEIYTATRPEAPWVLTNVINPGLATFTSHPPLLQFQFISLARDMALTVMMALSQLGPHVQEQTKTLPPNEVAPERLTQMEQLTVLNEREITRILELDMAPYKGDDKSIRELRDGMKDWLTQSTIRADPRVTEAVGKALQERNVKNI